MWSYDEKKELRELQEKFAKREQKLGKIGLIGLGILFILFLIKFCGCANQKEYIEDNWVPNDEPRTECTKTIDLLRGQLDKSCMHQLESIDVIYCKASIIRFECLNENAANATIDLQESYTAPTPGTKVIQKWCAHIEIDIRVLSNKEDVDLELRDMRILQLQICE
jgi:hypothetical protein